MLSLQRLQTLLQQSNDQLAAMRAVFERHQNEVTRFKGDTTRSQAYMNENIKADRDRAMGQLSAPLAIIKENSRLALAARPFWASKPLQLSRQRFSQDPAIDAAMKTAKLAEFVLLDSPMLCLIADNAVEDDDPATFWLANVANQAHAATLGAQSIDMDAIKLPEQAAALAVIDQLVQAPAHGELLVVMTSGQASSVQKLDIGHRMTAPAAPHRTDLREAS